MKLFFENLETGISVPFETPLEASLEQAVEIFDALPDDDGSSLGILYAEDLSVQFYRYNKFVWIVEIRDENKDGVYRSICNKNQCIRILEGLDEGINPFELSEFKFKEN